MEGGHMSGKFLVGLRGRKSRRRWRKKRETMVIRVGAMVKTRRRRMTTRMMIGSEPQRIQFAR
jgi:hypothetical protein